MGDSLQVCLGLASDLWPPEMQNQITETTSYLTKSDTNQCKQSNNFL